MKIHRAQYISGLVRNHITESEMEITEHQKPILILSHKNCEIHCCHLDGYGDNFEALTARMKIIEEMFCQKPHNSKFRIWYNVDENDLAKNMMDSIVGSLKQFDNRIYKIAFIGLKGMIKLRFERKLKKLHMNMPRAYFTDADKAKDWLI